MLRVLIVLAVALPLSARSLHWRAIDVRARLDGEGYLHVVERQQMVFDGDWNGGERDFALRSGQRVELQRLVRVENGREIPLRPGTLDEVDEYDFVTDGVLRWRSRMPADPPFRNREITYVLDYTYANILDHTLELAHDFALPARDGVIERFTLHVDFDPVWNTPPVTETREHLQPGQSVIVRRQLGYSGTGRPAAVRYPVPLWVGPAAVAFFAAGAALLIRAFIRGERAKGRFVPVAAQFDPSVLALRPEIAGALWDAGVGAGEVAATLARMAQEGKITTRVEGSTMHLHLEVARFELDGYERDLIDRLFVLGGDDTNTDLVREHYKRTGFDPSKVIRPGIEAELTRVIPGWNTKRKVPVLSLALTILVAFLVLFSAAVAGLDDTEAAAEGSLFSGAILGTIAAVVAWVKRRAVTDFVQAFLGPGVLLAIPAISFVMAAAASSRQRIGPFVLFAVALWFLAWLRLVLELLKIPDPPELIAYRKRIAGTRQFFVHELQTPQPALRDEWLPYVLAFGLAAHVDHWFRAFGAARTAAHGGSSGGWVSSSASPSSSWTGGGGAFGGAGATGSWALAAGTLAAGVARPSSGGGGGGARSGGGGGGGW